MFKTCGPCSFCCRMTAVPELKKKVGVWCNYHAMGKGCQVYSSRPPSCRSFQCLWLQSPHMSENLRPDRCKVMMEVLPNSPTIFALVDPNLPDAWKKKAVNAIFQTLVRAGHGVFVADGKQNHIIPPVGITPQQIWNDVASACNNWAKTL